ncbi:chromosome condensation membrane protein [Kingella potus]|uniref:Fluoride-specific ion channel FluC n=1 Tax=Kingella potus TaxID=265175 RepID=A0A377R427_9NEIS|nr:fluoride efflux transporter CrcB [Kingella potus]STR03226.1 chromosome condensation membrane protein [Kingella potus]
MNAPFFPAFLSVACGAVCGASARWLLGLWFASAAQPVPYATLAANWAGALFIGLAAGAAELFPNLPPYWKLWFVTGLLGSLTTFSGFSLETVALLQQQRYAAAILNAVLHLAGSLCLTAAGLWLARLFAR